MNRKRIAKNIVFNNTALRAQIHKQKLLQTFSKIIDTGYFLEGEQNQKLQKSLSKYFRNEYITLTASGHDALFIALQSLHLAPGDEVIFPVNAYPTAFPIFLSVAAPIMADVDENGQLSPESLEKKITKKTKAIVLVHLYGHIGNVEKIKKLTKGRNILLIEDCAQAFGSSYEQKLVGTLGDIGCFSFYPTKNFGTLGDGGAIVTKNKTFHNFFIQAKSYGEKTRYKSEFISNHSRLPELQAGVLNTYFSVFGSEVKKRKLLFLYYKKKLQVLKRHLCILDSATGGDPVPHLFVILTSKRNALQKYLKNVGIPTYIHYPFPIHMLQAFMGFDQQRGQYPIAEKIAKQVLSLPFHSHMQKNEVDFVAGKIAQFFQ